jgi:hypothetical protein
MSKASHTPFIKSNGGVPTVNTLTAGDQFVTEAKNPPAPRGVAVYNGVYATRIGQDNHRVFDGRLVRKPLYSNDEVRSFARGKISTHTSREIMKGLFVSLPAHITAPIEVTLLQTLHQLASPETAKWAEQNRAQLDKFFAPASILGLAHNVPQLRLHDGDIEREYPRQWLASYMRGLGGREAQQFDDTNGSVTESTGPTPSQTAAIVNRRRRTNQARTLKTLKTLAAKANENKMEFGIKDSPCVNVFEVNCADISKAIRPLRDTVISHLSTTEAA